MNRRANMDLLIGLQRTQFACKRTGSSSGNVSETELSLKVVCVLFITIFFAGKMKSTAIGGSQRYLNRISTRQWIYATGVLNRSLLLYGLDQRLISNKIKQD